MSNVIKLDDSVCGVPGLLVTKLKKECFQRVCRALSEYYNYVGEDLEVTMLNSIVVYELSNTVNEHRARIEYFLDKREPCALETLLCSFADHVGTQLHKQGILEFNEA